MISKMPANIIFKNSDYNADAADNDDERSTLEDLARAKKRSTLEDLWPQKL